MANQTFPQLTTDSFLAKKLSMIFMLIKQIFFVSWTIVKFENEILCNMQLEFYECIESSREPSPLALLLRCASP